MSMPIQRQSEQFSIFDDGPRYARDRSSTDLPQGLAGLINSTGPRIQAGLLNTRTAAGYDFGRGPRDHGGAGPDGGPAVPDWYYDGDSEDEEDDPLFGQDPDRFVPEHLVHGHRQASRRPFDRTAAHCPECDQPCDVEIEGHGYEEKYQEFPVSDCCGAELDDDGPDPDRDYDTWKDDQILDHDWHEGSLRPFDRAAAGRLAACQECGGDVLPRSGNWEHVDGPSDHLADPDDDDVANDEYGEGLDPARGMDAYKQHREGRRVALAPAPALQDPAMAPQVPVGGGFQAGHRVGLDWRDRTIPGTVIANDGQVHIRWDEGQYTSEDPSEVHLL